LLAAQATLLAHDLEHLLDTVDAQRHRLARDPSVRRLAYLWRGFDAACWGELRA
jgi:hypothetical protein